MKGEFGDAVSRLSAAQKSGLGAPLYSTLVNRPLGRLLAAGAYVLGLTPDAVTGLSALATATALVLLLALPGSVGAGLAVGGLLVLGYALDSADGQLARLRGGGSPRGEWLDHMVDAVKVVAIHAVTGLALARHFGVLRPELLIPVIFCLAASVHFFGMILTDQLMRTSPAGARAGDPGWWAVAKLPVDYGVLCLTYLAWGWPEVFLVAYGVQAVALVAYTAAILPRWYRRVGGLG